MKVILLEDIENLGKKYEIKEVKDAMPGIFCFPKAWQRKLEKKL